MYVNKIPRWFGKNGKNIATDAGYKIIRFSPTLAKYMLMYLLLGNDLHSNTMVWL